MRFFIALEIPEEDRAVLKEVQDRVKALLPTVRLNNNDKLHLTLAFVGEQPDTYKEALVNIIANATQGITPFSVTPGFIDGFPNFHHPHTIFVGVKGDIDKLQIIREKIKDGLQKLKLPVDERRFIPHIAIGKTKKITISSDIEAKLFEILSANFTPIRVSSIKLFESVPEGGFHRHNTLAEIKLS